MERTELSGLWYSRLPFLPEQKCCIVYWLWYEQSAWQELKHLLCNETNIPRQLKMESSGPNWRNAPLPNNEMYLWAVGLCWVLSPLAIVSNQRLQGKYIKTHIHHSIWWNKNYVLSFSLSHWTDSHWPMRQVVLEAKSRSRNRVHS